MGCPHSPGKRSPGLFCCPAQILQNAVLASKPFILLREAYVLCRHHVGVSVGRDPLVQRRQANARIVRKLPSGQPILREFDPPDQIPILRTQRYAHRILTKFVRSALSQDAAPLEHNMLSKEPHQTATGATCPPILPGAALPNARLRCDHLTTLEGATLSASATPRTVSPRSSRAIARSRMSIERARVMKAGLHTQHSW